MIANISVAGSISKYSFTPIKHFLRKVIHHFLLEQL